MSEVKKEAEVLKLTNVRVKYCKVIRPGKAYDDGMPDEWTTNIYPTPEDRDALMARVDLQMVVISLGIALISGLVAGLYPTWRVCRTQPAGHLKVQ